MLHAKYSDSDLTSLAPSSPPPPGQAYYVQSPSHEDGCDKSSASIHNTPVYNTTPTESPSRVSSAASRISGNFPRNNRYNRHTAAVSAINSWSDRKPILEDGPYDDFPHNKRNSRGCQTLLLLALAGFLILFALFCVILWGASRHHKPKIDIQSPSLSIFQTSMGTDRTGVPTILLTLNCSFEMMVSNPASTFGIHVSSTQISLNYYDLTIAKGQLQEYYQPRKSHHNVTIIVESKKIPLYGAGANIAFPNAAGAIPLTLDLNIFSRGNLMWKLMTVKHRTHILCPLVVHSSNTKIMKFSSNSCTYV